MPIKSVHKIILFKACKLSLLKARPGQSVQYWFDFQSAIVSDTILRHNSNSYNHAYTYVTCLSFIIIMHAIKRSVFDRIKRETRASLTDRTGTCRKLIGNIITQSRYSILCL